MTDPVTRTQVEICGAHLPGMCTVHPGSLTALTRLKLALNTEWAETDDSVLQNLALSLWKRCIEVLKSHEGKLNYSNTIE